jgi:IS30 family transposase
MPYTHLNQSERNVIQNMLVQKYSLSKIALAVGRNKSALSREIKKNTGLGQPYCPGTAQACYHGRQRNRIRYPKTGNPHIMNSVMDGLERGWSPEQIVGRMEHVEFRNDTKMRISIQTIYTWVKADKKSGGEWFKQLRRKMKKYKKRSPDGLKAGQIKHRVLIDERPKIVETQARFGDWECDTLFGKNSRAFIATAVERKSLYAVGGWMRDKSAKSLNAAMIRGFKDVPRQFLKSLTYDNGTEFAGHVKLERKLKVRGYFAHPYHAWERPICENTNGLLREYLPKKTDFRNVTKEYLEIFLASLNNRPRKKLNYRTPVEVFAKAFTVALTT